MILKFFKHLHMVNKHRYLVFKYCCKCGFPINGLFHDLSKYSFTEFLEGVKFYTGDNSPIANCKKQIGLSKAWLHHQGRNKHHIEYWYDRYNGDVVVMPFKYAVECVCDKIAATKCYFKQNYNPKLVLNHWEKYGSKVPMNENIKNFFNSIFNDLCKKSEKEILNKAYLKSQYEKYVCKNR